MADRNRRKSSILKLPKSSARAPLQDVNNLDCKSNVDDEFTSHTALARRRVSFAGKNFVKEFCSEAEIASVYHAPEYEELLASSESSGLVMSDSSSNTHSSTTINENNSTFASRTQLSAYKSVHVEDEYDPADEIMNQFLGKSVSHSKPVKSMGKTRLSFGDVRIPNFEEECPAVPAPVEYSKSAGPRVQNIQAASKNVKLVGQGDQTAAKTPEPVPLPSAIATTKQALPGGDRISSDNVLTPTEARNMFTSISSTLEDDVFDHLKQFLPQRAPNTVVKASHPIGSENAVPISEEPPREGGHFSSNECEDDGPADTTQCMNESMDFTKAVPGIIHLGCLQNPVAQEKQTQPEHLSNPEKNSLINCTTAMERPAPSNVQVGCVYQKDSGVANHTVAMNMSMEFTRPVPSNIEVGFGPEEVAPVTDRDGHMANHTVAMNMSMDFTRPVPSNIEVGFGPQEVAEIPDKRSGFANRTVAMDTSMDFTRPVPSNIEVGFGPQEVAEIPDKRSGFENHTVAMDTSMDFTKPVPSNIQVGFGPDDVAASHEEGRGFANCTVAVNMSMDFTKPVPSNIRVGFCSKEVAEVSDKKNGFANHTVAMDTSMDFTKPVPSNIEVGFGHKDVSEIPDKESGMAMNTSVDITRGAPSGIQVGFSPDHVAATHEDHRVANRTVAINMSMDFTKPVPSNIEVGFGHKEVAEIPDKESNMAMNTSVDITRGAPLGIQAGFSPDHVAGIHEEDHRVANHTVAMNMSMDFTKPVPSNIEVGFGHKDVSEIPDKESAMAMNTSVDSTRGAPSGIEVGFGPDDVAGIREDHRVANRTVAMNMSMDFTKPVPSNIQVGFGYKEVADVYEKNSGIANCAVATSASKEPISPAPLNTKDCIASSERAGLLDSKNVVGMVSGFVVEPDNAPKVQSNVVKEDLVRFSSAKNSPKSSIVAPEDIPRQVEGRFSLITNPFQSKPRLISSPPSQSGIESVHVQFVPKSDFDVHQNEGKPAERGMRTFGSSNTVDPSPNDREKSQCSEPFKSKPIPILSLPVETSVTEGSLHQASLITSRNIEVSHSREEVLLVSRTSNPTAANDSSGFDKTSQTGDFDPLLDVTNPFKSKSRLMNTPLRQKSEFPAPATSKNVEVDPQTSAVRSGNGTQSTLGNVLGDIGNDHSMLADEPPPFLDVPSINMEISECMNDSGANLLHTTIKNAEMTLRQMHGSDLEDSQPAAVHKRLSCSVELLENMDCDHVPCEEQTRVTQQASNEDDSPLSQELLGHGDGSTASRSSEVVNETEKKNPKRSREDSLACGTIDLERPCDGTSTKRFRPEAVKDKCHKKSSYNFSSDLSCETSDAFGSDISNENCSTASEPPLSLHDMIPNSDLWKATQIGEGLWAFKFNFIWLELRIHLKQSSTAQRIIEGSSGYFVTDIPDPANPIKRWGTSMLMNKLRTQEWDSLLHHSPNFLQTMEKLEAAVIEHKKFLVETIIQAGLLNLKFTDDSFSVHLWSLKLHFCFKITVKLDLLEKLSPRHVEVKTVFGNIRETEVKNLITGVKKDIYFARNYLRDIKDYIKILESFCK